MTDDIGVSEAMPILDLRTLGRGLPAVTPAFGASLAEAGGVCFEDQGHRCGVQLYVNGKSRQTYEVHWPRVDDQTLRCWNDYEVTTECGAYGVAFLLMVSMTDFTIIERSRKGTGFDYWLGYQDELPFSNKARLEVSGIRKGDKSAISGRVKKKLRQTNPTDGKLPAYVVVVEFSSPLSQVAEK